MKLINHPSKKWVVWWFLYFRLFQVGGWFNHVSTVYTESFRVLVLEYNGFTGWTFEQLKKTGLLWGYILLYCFFFMMPHFLPLGLHWFPPGERGEFRHGTKGGVHLGLGRLGSAVPGGRALPTEEWWKTAGGESWPLGFGRVGLFWGMVWCYQKNWGVLITCEFGKYSKSHISKTQSWHFKKHEAIKTNISP